MKKVINLTFLSLILFSNKLALSQKPSYCNKIQETTNLVSDILKSQNKDVSPDNISEFLNKNMDKKQRELYIAGSLACAHADAEKIKNKTEVNEDNIEKLKKQDLSGQIKDTLNKFYSNLEAQIKNLPYEVKANLQELKRKAKSAADQAASKIKSVWGSVFKKKS